MILLLVFLVITSIIKPGATFAQQTTATDTSQKLTAVGTSTIWGSIDNVAIEGIVQGPSTEVTPLQVACVFEYTEGDIFNSPPALPATLNGMVHLDNALKGIITDIRKSGRFTGHAFETLLITPPAGTIAAKKLLLIGLGNRNNFTPDIMISIGSVAMREALRLGVDSYAFGSDLKDAGIDSPTALVAGNVVKGSFQAYRTQACLKNKNMSDYKPLAKITLLAGPAFYKVAGDGIKEAIASFNNSIR
jgi:Cytosol aminopeptidase family, N-terminal domain